jgi:hypothetical protein
VAGQEAVPPVGLEPGTWQVEREADEEVEEEDAGQKKGKGHKKTRTQKGRAKRRVEWEDESAEW